MPGNITVANPVGGQKEVRRACLPEGDQTFFARVREGHDEHANRVGSGSEMNNLLFVEASRYLSRGRALAVIRWQHVLRTLLTAVQGGSINSCGSRLGHIIFYLL